MDTIHREPLFSAPAESFSKHLVQKNNRRILFSGKFGIGKTYFLNYFFRTEVQQEVLRGQKYNVFHIYPVNYSIANNEDIFRYIKYDIISAMLLNGAPVQDSQYTFIDALPSYIQGNLDKVLTTLLYMIPKVGKDLYDSYNKLKELKEHFKQCAQIASEGDVLSDYLNLLEFKEGSVFENDAITKMISTILKRFKKDSGRENILVIDDLDRIDPEHIFRLLNVFAAHLDEGNGLSNKLGFDKVIIVCDINNVRNIFRAKYGVDTDFNGYIDKFYSIEVFHLDNTETLQDIAFEAFKKSAILAENEQSRRHFQHKLFRDSSFAIDILHLLIANSKISLRALLNRVENCVEIDAYRRLYFSGNDIISQSDYPLLVHFKILKDIIGNYDDIKEMIKSIPSQSLVLRHMNAACAEMLYFITYSRHRFNSNSTNLTHYLFDRLLFLKIDHIRQEQYTLQAADDRFTPSGEPPTHEFTREEFVFLLGEFLDILKRVKN